MSTSSSSTHSNLTSGTTHYGTTSSNVGSTGNTGVYGTNTTYGTTGNPSSYGNTVNPSGYGSSVNPSTYGTSGYGTTTTGTTATGIGNTAGSGLPMYTGNTGATTGSYTTGGPTMVTGSNAGPVGTTTTSTTTTRSGNNQGNQQNADPNVPSSGLVHTVKKSMAGSNASAEPEWDSALSRFQQLNDATARLKEQLGAYIQNVFAVNESQNNVAIAFNSLLMDETFVSPYASLSQESYNAHRMLCSSREKTTAAQLAQKSIQQLENQLNAINNQQERIQQRHKLKDEYNYYLKKLEKLTANRDKTLTGGKELSESDAQRYERNVKKTKVAEQRFKEYNYAIVSDLNHLWGKRVTIIGPALLEFINTERQLAQLQQDMLGNIKTNVDVDAVNRDFMKNYSHLLPTDSQSSSASLVLAEASLQRPTPLQNVTNQMQQTQFFGDDSPLTPSSREGLYQGTGAQGYQGTQGTQGYPSSQYQGTQYSTQGVQGYPSTQGQGSTPAVLTTTTKVHGVQQDPRGTNSGLSDEFAKPTTTSYVAEHQRKEII